MKAHREAAEKAMSAKLRRLGAQGDKKFAMKGADKKGYASGGGIPMGADDGMDIGGGMPKPNLSKPARGKVGGKKGKGKGGKTNVNVIVMSGKPGGDDMGKPPLPPMDGPPGGPPMMPPKPPMMPPGGPGMGPPGGGPPLPPMRKFGGRVKMAGASKPVGKSRKGC